MVVGILNGATALLSVILGLRLWKRHSVYPDIRVGYHVGRAILGEREWNYANEIAGKLCLGGGVTGFVALPGALRLLGCPEEARMGLYLLTLVVWGGCSLFLPNYLLGRKQQTGTL